MHSQQDLIFVDTDIGDDIDDALALAVALRSPEIELLGVTTVFGDTQLRARLTSRLLQVFGREDIPIAAGLELPMLSRHRPSGVPQAAILDKSDGLTGISALTAPELIVQTALAHYGNLTLLCLGPLTNIAAALRLEPRLFMAIRRIIMMGGTSGIPWAEWNVRSDAGAAQIVLAAGIPVTMIGWNITTRCQMSVNDIHRLHQQKTPQAQFLFQLLSVWQRHRPRWQTALPYLHDPLTIAGVCAPQLMQFEEMTVRILLNGPFRGYMVPRLLDGPLVHAAVNIDVTQARHWIMQRLLHEQ